MRRNAAWAQAVVEHYHAPGEGFACRPWRTVTFQDLGVRGRNNTAGGSGAQKRNHVEDAPNAQGGKGIIYCCGAQGRNESDNGYDSPEKNGSVGTRGAQWRNNSVSGAQWRNNLASGAQWRNDSAVGAQWHNNSVFGAQWRDNSASDVDNIRGAQWRNIGVKVPYFIGPGARSGLSVPLQALASVLMSLLACGCNARGHLDIDSELGAPWRNALDRAPGARWRKVDSIFHDKSSFLALPHAVSAKTRNRRAHTLNGNQAAKQSLRPSELKAKIREIMVAHGPPPSQTEYLYNKLHHETSPSLLQSIASQSTMLQKKAALRMACDSAGIRLEARRPAEQAGRPDNAGRWVAAAAGRAGGRPADAARGKGPPGTGKGLGKGQGGKGARKGGANDGEPHPARRSGDEPPSGKSTADHPQLFHRLGECEWVAGDPRRRVDICQGEDVEGLLHGGIAAVSMRRARELYFELSGGAAEPDTAVALVTTHQIVPPGETEPLQAEMVQIPFLTAHTGELTVMTRCLTQFGADKVQLAWTPHETTGPARAKTTRMIGLISGDYTESKMYEFLCRADDEGWLEQALLADGASASWGEQGVFRRWISEAGAGQRPGGAEGGQDGHVPKIYQLYRSPAAKKPQAASAFGNRTWTCSFEIDTTT
eukprot:gene1183-1053_t